MQPTLAKKLARRLMALALLISPPNSRAWIRAMAAELDYVDGSSKALSWSIGCFGAALKQLCVSVLSPGSFGSETEGSMSKFAKISAIVLIAASAFFLFAPTFRQGIKLTISSWRLSSDDAWLSEMRKLGAEAEARHDARALAFVAMQLNSGWESDSRIAAKDHSLRDKFADEAVQWNAGLTWVYTSMLSRDQYPGWPDARDPSDIRWPARLPNDARWIASLEAWDPNNAVVYAGEASFYRPRGISEFPQSDRALLARSPRWLNTMEKAFSATNYDSYVTRKALLDSDVARRYGLNDPSRALLGVGFYRFNGSFNFELYARDVLLQSGEDFEANGDLARAEQSYWKIAHLAGLMQLRDDSYHDRMGGIELQLMAGPKLQETFEKTGNASAASLVAYQTEIAQKSKADFLSTHRWANVQSEFRPVEAWTVQLSLLGIATALTLILFPAGYFAVQAGLGRKAARSPFLSKLGLAGTVLLLASAIAMYFSFAPYAAALQSYLAGPNPENAFADLARFQVLQTLPAGALDWFLSAPSKVFFWYTVIALGGVIIVWILYRQISRTLRRSAPVQPAA